MRPCLPVAVAFLAFVSSASVPWEQRINLGPAGHFPPPASFSAEYRVTWANLQAAHVEAKCVSPENGTLIQTSIKAGTNGAARLLYKLDATAVCEADGRTLRPIRFAQTQDVSGKRHEVRVEFTPQEAVRFPGGTANTSKADGSPDRPRHFRFPDMLDMHSALLYLRSLPLNNGDEKTFALMSANSPYLVTVKSVGRTRVHVPAGDFPAIVCALSLQHIDKHGDLEEHKKFKSARAYLSDDDHRMLLKIETEIFIGSVDLELEKVTYPPPGNQ